MACVQEASISSAGLATEQCSAANGAKAKRAAVVCGAVAAAALSAVVLRSRRS